ncbi:outer membrane protein assembly factor BamB [Piscirickettsia litoralis]|uniref:Outer membrane protein assembly factor BamB n=1 Tax=Piscirickettsia litoralis TaxID=1891921 RepID=A0ABX3A5U0_9GAMM|nr:outer membrane protein assembly factor BamB [Piscirickettsia litoralis]ODN43803.1 outer membrane protein assembly factor BamB [Piscirickettsia litoralis]
MNNWKKLAVTGIGLLAVALAGCSSYKDNTIAPAPLKIFKPQVAVLESWKTQVGAGSGSASKAVLSFGDEGYWQYQAAENWHLNVTRDGKNLYAVDYKGLVESLSLQGKVNWKANVNQLLTASPVAGPEYVYVVTAEGTVLALNKQTGKTEWKKPLDTLVIAAPAAAKGIVVIHTKAGAVIALSATNGQQLWRYDPLLNPPMTMERSSMPVISGQQVIIGNNNGQVVALGRKTGDLLWQYQVAVSSGASEVAQIVDVDATPVVKDGAVYVSSVKNRTAAVSLQSGRMLWEHKTGSFSGLAVSKDKVIITANNGALWALNRETGKTVWIDSSLLGRHPTAPALVGDYVVVGDYKGFVHWFSLKTGKLLGRMSVGPRAIVGQPVVDGQTAYVMDASGRLVAVRGSKV